MSSTETKCKCPICGKSGLNILMIHVVKSHKMSKEEFLYKYPNSMMITESSKSTKSKIMSERNTENWNNNDEYREYHLELNRQNGIKVMSDPIYVKQFSNKGHEACRTPEVLAKRSLTMTRRNIENWKDNDYREWRSEQSSITMQRQWDEDYDKMMENHFTGYKKYPYKDFIGKSSWEPAFAKILDDNNIKYIYEDRSKVTIWYDENGIDHKYNPDFYLPEYDVLFEIKPDYKVNTYETQAKIKSSKDAGYKIALFTESDEWSIDHIMEIINELRK